MNREESIMFAKKYTEDLMSFFGLNVDVYASAEEDVIELSVPSSYLSNLLIGRGWRDAPEYSNTNSFYANPKEGRAIPR